MAKQQQTAKAFRTVANYELNVPEDLLALRDYKEVVADLAAGDRAKYFMTGIGDYIDRRETTENAIAVLTGQHAVGFRMSVIKAQDKGAPVYLPVCEDTVTGKLLVVGPRGGASAMTGDVVYVESGLDVTKDKINDFLVEGMRYRGDKHLVSVREVWPLIEDLLQAALTMAQPKGAKQKYNIYAPGLTVGFLFNEVASGITPVGACMLVPAVRLQAPKSGRP